MRQRRLGMVTAISCVSLLGGCASARLAGAGSPCGAKCGKCTDKSGEKPCCSDTSKWAKFGSPMKLAANKTICADKILADKIKFDGKVVRVCGKVETVCARKGCWIRIGDGDAKETLFVKFTCPVGGRLVPMAAAGKRVIAEGTLKVTEISEADARHYEEDAGASPEEIAKIVGPQKMITLAAPSAIIEGVTAPTT